MKHRHAIVVALALSALLLGAAVYMYDSSRSDAIAEGVTVGGVDIGGLSPVEARARLRHEIKKPLERPIRVIAGAERFELSAGEAAVRVDLDAMVADALAESRQGNILARTVRALTGSSLDVALPARIAYSREAVSDLVDKVESRLERPARDANVEPSGAGLEVISEQAGVDVRAVQLRRAVTAELEAPDGDRRVDARTRTVAPDLTGDELAERHPHYLTLDRAARELRHYENLKLAGSYTVAVGRPGFETPSGHFDIANKAIDPAWHVPEWGGALAGQVIPGGASNNPLKARWLGITDGVGIHGTDDVASLGTAASHGCIRMSVPDVVELYDEIPVETPIHIE